MNTKKDFSNYIKENLHDIVESHLDCWNDRYKKYKCKDLKTDLDINHDFSLEIEGIEDELKREISEFEEDLLIKKFIKEALRQFKR